MRPEDIDVDTERARINAHVMEAMQELFHRLPFGTQITLANGKTATIKPFYEPEIAPEESPLAGRARAGVDISYDDGSAHFEFTLYQSGWGGSVS